MPGVHVEHHQLVALGAEDDLFVGEPLAAEDLWQVSGQTCWGGAPAYLTHLVDIGLGYRVLL